MLWHLRRSTSNNTQVASIPNTQILFSNTIFQQKEPGILGEIHTGANTHDKGEKIVGRKCLKKQNKTPTMMGMSTG
jgi:hypothetical protein